MLKYIELFPLAFLWILTTWMAYKDIINLQTDYEKSKKFLLYELITMVCMGFAFLYRFVHIMD